MADEIPVGENPNINIYVEEEAIEMIQDQMAPENEEEDMDVNGAFDRQNQVEAAVAGAVAAVAAAAEAAAAEAAAAEAAVAGAAGAHAFLDEAAVAGPTGAQAFFYEAAVAGPAGEPAFVDKSAVAGAASAPAFDFRAAAPHQQLEEEAPRVRVVSSSYLMPEDLAPNPKRKNISEAEAAPPLVDEEVPEQPSRCDCLADHEKSGPPAKRAKIDRPIIHDYHAEDSSSNSSDCYIVNP